MKKFVGAILSLLTVFLLGSGFLFGSVSVISSKKWNADLTKINLEEELFESDSDTDDDSFDLSDYQFGLKKWDKKLLAEQVKIKFYAPCNLVGNQPCFNYLLEEKPVDQIPLWLKVRQILI